MVIFGVAYMININLLAMEHKYKYGYDIGGEIS